MHASGERFSESWGIGEYAEELFALMLNGKLMGRNNPGFDVLAPRVGRVEVKSRDRTVEYPDEERLHCKNGRGDGCDFLGAVLFAPDGLVDRGLLVPYAQAWELICGTSYSERKIPFRRSAALPGCRDVTKRLRKAHHRMRRR
jgi:hypothetical protein